MADNVNIIVQDTINDIVVNAAVVVETIDINVQAAVDTVDIVANPNNYVVNINRIIGEQVQSDWDQADNQAPDYIKNKPTIPTATSDLTNDGEDGINPFITAADVTPQVQSDWDQADNQAPDYIKNKPTIPTATSDLTNDGENGVDPFITAADIPPVTGFVPYTGATDDVNLGEFGLLTGNVEFDNTPTNIPTTAGAMYWNDADGTADLILKGGNVKLQVGQESVLRVVNKTATNINLLEANYQAVRVTGAQGQRLKVDLAQATTDNLSAETIGLVTETINNNQEGFITTSGLVRGINTTGSLQGETWADGDILYLSPTTTGNVTKVKPVAPNHLVIVGYVVHAHVNQGSIFVKVDNGYELDELHNVKITSAANNNVLAYTSATDIWENKTVETALGYTPFQLPSLTSGSVLFSNGSTIAQDNAQLFWNDTNNRLGIGTNAPTTALDVNANYNFNTGVGRILNIKANSGPTVIAGFGTGMNFGLKIGSGAVEDVAYIDVLNTQTFRSGDISLKVSQGSSPTEAMRISYLGNILLGTSINAGYKLDVNGTARVSGNATFGTLGTGTGMFWDNTNNRLGIGTNAPAAKVTIQQSNQVYAPIDLVNFDMALGIAADTSLISGLDFKNFNSTGQVRLMARNNQNDYIAINTYGTTAAGTLFGINRTNIHAIFGQGTFDSTKKLAIGTFNVGDLILGTNNTERMRIFAGGNVAINTTTDAGYKLDVNGTARFSGIVRYNNTSSNYLNIDGSATGSNNCVISNRFNQIQIVTNTGGGTPHIALLPASGGSVGINTSIIDVSAITQINSTTKGFLPPRMTTTQKNAIATPAAGLVVYDTTDNKHYGYNGTTWNAFY
jgi:hypothetical protein